MRCGHIFACLAVPAVLISGQACVDGVCAFDTDSGKACTDEVCATELPSDQAVLLQSRTKARAMQLQLQRYASNVSTDDALARAMADLGVDINIAYYGVCTKEVGCLKFSGGINIKDTSVLSWGGDKNKVNIVGDIFLRVDVPTVCELKNDKDIPLVVIPIPLGSLPPVNFIVGVGGSYKVTAAGQFLMAIPFSITYEDYKDADGKRQTKDYKVSFDPKVVNADLSVTLELQAMLYVALTWGVAGSEVGITAQVSLKGTIALAVEAAKDPQCPSRSQVLETPWEERWAKWDAKDNQDCPMSGCGSEAEDRVPCRVKKTDKAKLSISANLEIPVFAKAYYKLEIGTIAITDTLKGVASTIPGYAESMGQINKLIKDKVKGSHEMCATPDLLSWLPDWNFKIAPGGEKVLLNEVVAHWEVSASTEVSWVTMGMQPFKKAGEICSLDTENADIGALMCVTGMCGRVGMVEMGINADGNAFDYDDAKHYDAWQCCHQSNGLSKDSSYWYCKHQTMAYAHSWIDDQCMSGGQGQITLSNYGLSPKSCCPYPAGNFQYDPYGVYNELDFCKGGSWVTGQMDGGVAKSGSKCDTKGIALYGSSINDMCLYEGYFCNSEMICALYPPTAEQYKDKWVCKWSMEDCTVPLGWWSSTASVPQPAS